MYHIIAIFLANWLKLTYFTWKIVPITKISCKNSYISIKGVSSGTPCGEGVEGAPFLN